MSIFVENIYSLIMCGYRKSFSTQHLKNRWQKIKVNASFSSWFELLLGVPQGLILEALLFNNYLNDLFYLAECTNACSCVNDTNFMLVAQIL